MAEPSESTTEPVSTLSGTLTDNVCAKVLRELEERPQEHTSTLSQLVEEMENVTIHYLFEVGDPSLKMISRTKATYHHDCTSTMCISYATCGCYRLIDAIVERWPGYVLHDFGDLFHRALFPTESLLHTPSLSLNTKLLRKLLAAGADPNRAITITVQSKEIEWSTVWCVFLQRLSGKKSANVIAMERFLASTMNHGILILAEMDPIKTFSSPDVHTAIRYFLEFGAELELLPELGADIAPILDSDGQTLPDGRIDPLATLRRYLPMDADSEWPALLESYQQPKMREELREARRKLVDSLERQSKEKMLV
jgi:hypothetical protein